MYVAGLGTYYLKNGQPVDTLYVGDTLTFNVPGYSQIWLDQYQNGQLQYSGPFNLPMPPYTLLPRDAGSFIASLFKLSPNGQRGDNIGTDRVTVLAAPPATIYQPPIVVGGGAPVYAPGTVSPSGAGTVSAGIPTPSAPPTIVVQTPSGPVDFGTPAPAENHVPAQVTEEAGLSMLSLLLLGGAAVFYLGSTRR